MPDSRTALLQGMPIFGAVSDDAIAFLLQRARLTQARAGEAFFREDDAASSLFVLESGRAEVLKGWQGRELALRVLGPGDCFGEMSLMDLQPRSATVVARADCVALEIGADLLWQLCEHDLQQFALIQMNLGREVCRRLRATDELLFEWQARAPGSAPAPASVAPRG